MVHTPSAGSLRVSEVLQQQGYPLRHLGWRWRAWGRFEALWRGKWLFLWITAAGGGVECCCLAEGCWVPLLTPLECSGVLVAVLGEC